MGLMSDISAIRITQEKRLAQDILQTQALNTIAEQAQKQTILITAIGASIDKLIGEIKAPPKPPISGIEIKPGPVTTH